MRDMADELLKLYARAQLAHGLSFSTTATGSASLKTLSSSPRPRTSSAASRRNQARHGRASSRWIACCAAMSDTARPKWSMRAAFKALGDGKQVVVLAPLRYWCFSTSRRSSAVSSPFPVRIEMLSRFRSNEEIKEVLADTADRARWTSLIGTHRLLSQDVEFQCLAS